MTGPTLYMLVVLVLYALGLLAVKKFKVKTHIGIMSLAVLMDFGLTLWLELSRAVFDQSFGAAHTGFEYNRDILFWVHIPVATLLLISYFVTGILGWLTYRKKTAPDKRPVYRKRHTVFGYITLALYMGSFVSAPGFILDWIAGLF